jgi:hypothetical protein
MHRSVHTRQMSNMLISFCNYNVRHARLDEGCGG